MQSSNPSIGGTDISGTHYERRASVDGTTLVLITLVCTFAILVIRTAWLSDDSYITLRTLDNFVNGYGLRWNIDERVQSFTHPLWLFSLAIPYAVTREGYFTPLVLSMVLSIATVCLLVTRGVNSRQAAVLPLVLLTFSRAFVEFSTSGLENALSHFLLLVFTLIFASERRRPWVPWLIASLLMLNRLDLGLLVLPSLVVDAWRRPWRESLRAACLGLIPLLAWELFSLIYYGALVPNTGYAKLRSGIGTGELILQGVTYGLDTIGTDPVTAIGIALGCGVAWLADRRRAWPFVLGVVLYLGYVVRIGGDFMSGRFFTAPLLVSVILLSWTPWRRLQTVTAPLFVTIALLGVVATSNPPIMSNADTFVSPLSEARTPASGIVDERMYYYRYTGLLRWSRAAPLPQMGLVDQGRALRGTHQTLRADNAGFVGFFAGPDVHLIDPFALADPLLARLPSLPHPRIGHFEREIPAGYLESVASGENRIVDQRVAQLYRDVKTVTVEPIWSRHRWRVILRLSLADF